MKLALKLRPIYRYFYTEWDSPKTTWLTESPTSLTFEGQVRWRLSPQPITVCCRDVTGKTDLFTPTFSQWYSRRDVPMLKSALQKSIRRGLGQEALQIAWQLLNVDTDAFLRRLGVIMVEDVILVEEFSTLAWLVSAVSKGYQLRQFQVMWLLGLIGAMCTDVDTEPAHEQGQPDDASIVKDLMLCQDPRKRHVLLSVMFRVSYGGMPGDLELFRHCVIDRLHENVKSYTGSLTVPNEIPSPLKRCDIPLASADFHCFPQILEDIHIKFPSFGVDEIKSCLWEYNSKINYRKDRKSSSDPEDPKLKTMWDTIQPLVSELQRRYL